MSKELAKDYFERHTKDECHITSDHRVFHTAEAATGHANTLRDYSVKKYARVDFEGEAFKNEDSENEGSEDEGSGNEGSEDEGSDNEALRNEALEALKTVDTTMASYQDLKALVKASGIKTENQKQEVLIAAIEAYRATVNTEVTE